MKALSLKHPWMQWVLDGKKTIETRTWTTKHRGDVLFCSSKRLDDSAMNPNDPEAKTYAYGKALCLVRLVDVRLMTEDDEHAAMCFSEQGRYSWVIEDVRRLAKPFDVKGSLGLFDVEVPDELELVL